MKKRKIYLTLLVWSLFALPMQAKMSSAQQLMTIDTAVVPGVEYLLYNVGSGLYLTKTGAMVANAADADAWRFLSTETTTFIHSDRIFVYMKNMGNGLVYLFLEQGADPGNISEYHYSGRD